MVCFVTNHYTAKAFSVLALSIRGLGLLQMVAERALVLVGAVSTVCPIDIEGREAGSHSPGDQ